MKELKEQLNYSLKIYNDDGSLLDYTEYPGEVGDWMMFGEDAPIEAALYVINKNEVLSQLFEKYDILDASRTKLDADLEEIDDMIEKGILICNQHLDTLKGIAALLGVEFFYFFGIDVRRYISVVDANTGEEEIYSFPED